MSDSPDIELLVPPDEDDRPPKLSIVVPALDEEVTIAEFVSWCHDGLAKADVPGEILVVDSGRDRTTELALAGGARVLRTPRRGLGRAYIDALPHIRGDWVVMGDADCTYDFRDLSDFVARFEAGYEFVMGSRWRGSIEPGSMPWLHQHLGTPVTTKVLNLLFRSRFTDIHCGMRGITREALLRMDLRSQSWEYASEMVIKAVHLGLRTTEVPVHFLKDRDGRSSHHVRAGWTSPWKAAWINLRAMFVHGADTFTLLPGLALAAAGLALTLPLTFGPRQVGGVTLSLYWMLLGLTLTVVGVQSFYLGCIARMLYDHSGRVRARWTRVFAYTRTVLACAGLAAAGTALAAPLVRDYLANGLRLPAVGATSQHMAITGLLALILAFSTFSQTLLVHATALHTRRGDG
ncbi:MAG TPA: glycosyltransferase family 2 protein [Acidimicrobiales bacterium]